MKKLALLLTILTGCYNDFSFNENRVQSFLAIKDRTPKKIVQQNNKTYFLCKNGYNNLGHILIFKNQNPLVFEHLIDSVLDFRIIENNIKVLRLQKEQVGFQELKETNQTTQFSTLENLLFYNPESNYKLNSDGENIKMEKGYNSFYQLSIIDKNKNILDSITYHAPKDYSYNKSKTINEHTYVLFKHQSQKQSILYKFTNSTPIETYQFDFDVNDFCLLNQEFYVCGDKYNQATLQKTEVNQQEFTIQTSNSISSYKSIRIMNGYIQAAGYKTENEHHATITTFEASTLTKLDEHSISFPEFIEGLIIKGTITNPILIGSYKNEGQLNIFQLTF